MKILVRAFVALLPLLWPVAVATGQAAPAEASQANYAYTAPLAPTEHDCDHVQRGPPPAGAATDQRAVDGGSYRTSARPRARAAAVTYTYDGANWLSQVYNSTGMTARHAGAVDGELSAIQATGVAANAGAGANNAANGLRLGQQLARESAESAFSASGRLSPGAISGSRQIIPGSRLGNKELTQRLTADGSRISDWGKYTTRTHQSPSGDFQVHFYMNRGTGAIDYGYDYKVIFNGGAR